MSETDETLIAARDEAREAARSLFAIAERALGIAVTVQATPAQAELTTRHIHALHAARLKIQAWETEE